MAASPPLRSSADPTACGSVRSDRSSSPTARAACVEIHADGTLSTIGGTNTYDVRSVTGDAGGNLYAAARNPDYIIQVDLNTALVNVVVGTGTSGYNSNTDSLTGLLLPGPQVQINAPGGLSVDLNGNVLFADTGNSLIRAYVPSSGNVIDDLGGVANTNNDTTQSGFNGDGKWADQTLLNSPAAVTATSGSLLVVADTGNARLRQLGPAPLNESASVRAVAATGRKLPSRAATAPENACIQTDTAHRDSCIHTDTVRGDSAWSAASSAFRQLSRFDPP